MSVILRKVAFKTIWLIESCYCYLIALTCYFAGSIGGTLKRQEQSVEFDLHTSDINTNISLYSTETKTISEVANQVLAHKVKIFDSKCIYISKANIKSGDLFGANNFINSRNYCQIDWHCDCKNGYRWHKLAMPYLILRKLPPQPNVDIKWPWELSRFQHTHVLAIAACANNEMTNKKEYWVEFREQITDWITNNPYGLGVNWVCAMDVAIRAVNWLVSFYLFGKKVDLSDNWQHYFFKSIEQHGKYLYKKIKKPYGKKGNHYVSELAGLYLIGLLCPFFNLSGEWRELSKKDLENQIKVQVRPDGSHFEDSTSYHLLVTEIFLYTGILADSLNDSFSVEYRNTVEKMVNVITKIASSRYDVPQIGDNDDGYFIKPIFMDANHTRAGHILNLGGQYINQKIEWNIRVALVDIVLVKKQEMPRSAPQAFAFEDAGWVVLEDGPIKIIMCVGSPKIKFRGGHSHEDILSFTLYWKGLPVIVDPGTYVYTPNQYLRNKFRYAISHNQPQYEIDEKKRVNNKVFAQTYMPTTKYSISDENKQKTIYAESKYENYIVKRKIKIDTGGSCIAISDDLNGSMSAKCFVSFCLHPEVNCKACNNVQFELTVGEDKLVLESDGIFQKKKTVYSPSYGLINETVSLVGEVGNIKLKLL